MIYWSFFFSGKIYELCPKPQRQSILNGNKCALVIHLPERLEDTDKITFLQLCVDMERPKCVTEQKKKRMYYYMTEKLIYFQIYP